MLLLIVALAAAAQPVDESGMQPSWLRKPSFADIARAYPPSAAARGLEGRAMLMCLVSATGKLKECEVVAESPSNEGFGAAALRLSRHFQLPAPDSAELAAGVRIRLPLRFNPEWLE